MHHNKSPPSNQKKLTAMITLPQDREVVNMLF